MQRLAFPHSISALLVLALLYVTPTWAATADESAPTDARVVVRPVTMAAPANQPFQPHIALLLPLNSPLYGKVADAVQQGFLAASEVSKRRLPVRVYPCNDEAAEAPGLYQLALRNGAVAVAGPLTRAGVAAIASSSNLTTPTLALNQIEAQRSDSLYFFSLPPEDEARQAAMMALASGLHDAYLVTTGSPLSKRLTQAFTEQWQKYGGTIHAEVVYSGDVEPVRNLSPDLGSMVFLAAEPNSARLVRPFIHGELPVFATSMVFAGNQRTLTNFDMADVRFMDMPWLVQQDHPAVMVYPRSTTELTLDQERLYALGIDAYRLLQVMQENHYAQSLPLDGVTGKVTLNGHVFQRTGARSMFRQGVATALGGM